MKSVLKKEEQNRQGFRIRKPAVITCLESRIYRDQARENGFGCWKSTVGYRFADGPEMFEVACDYAGRDRYDHYSQRFSPDNGITWQSETAFFRRQETNAYICRISELFQELIPEYNMLLRMYDLGFFPNDTAIAADDVNASEFHDDALESFCKSLHVFAQCSFNGGADFTKPEDLSILYQQRFNPDDTPCISCAHAISCQDKCIRVPMYVIKPGNGGTEARILIAEARENTLQWNFGGILPRPEIENLRLTEGSLAELPDGRLIALYRADTIDGKTDTPWLKWLTVSEDGGSSWQQTAPLCYDPVHPVISPSSQPRLILHSSGRLFFIGNILQGKCDPYLSRNSLSIIEIDTGSLMAIPESLTIIDARNPDDLPFLAISNFTALEDRFSGNILVYSPRTYNRAFSSSDSILMKHTLKISEP